jgi:hypothetical protein
MEILVVIISWLLFGGASSYFAKQRGRDPFAWFLIGMFLGILGLLLLFLLPPIATPVPVVEEKTEELAPQEDAMPYRLKAWYYLDSMRNPIGPISFNELKKTNVQSDTLIWCEGMVEWKTVAELPDLKEALL